MSQEIEIIPCINVPTFGEVTTRAKKIEGLVAWCHIDVTDGKFSLHKTWNDPMDLRHFETPLSIEMHLMVNEPEKVISQWLVPCVKRIIVHFEAAKDIEKMQKICRDAGVEFGLAARPEMPMDLLDQWLGKVDLIQVLAVNPGPSGQELQEVIFEKIIHIRLKCSGCIIEVDGGMNQKTIPRAVFSGASLVVAASAIFTKPDVPLAIANLRIIARGSQK